jgi:branched-chain amino acid aminotransferase
MGECCKDIFLLNGESKNRKDFKESWLETKGAVYEVFRLLDGKPFRPHDNIQRLRESLALINYEYPIDENLIVSRIEKLAELDNVSQGNVKYVLLKDDNKYIELMFFISHYYPSIEENKEGVKTLMLHAKRLNPTIKMINKDLRGLANSIITEKNVFEVLLVNDMGYVTEGSRSNFFMVKNDVVYTPPIDTVLPGTVRKRVIEICQNNDIEIVEKNIHYSRLHNYNAAFLTATSLGVLPINSINSDVFEVDNSVLRFLQNEYSKLLGK